MIGLSKVKRDFIKVVVILIFEIFEVIVKKIDLNLNIKEKISLFFSLMNG